MSVPLRDYQLFQLNILREFKRVCDLYGLRWHLCWGSLLGAARHKGFIPWDDDIDVSMPPEDYLAFREIAREELGEEFYLQSHVDNPQNIITWQRIGVKNSTSMSRRLADIHAEWGVCMDIFPLMPYIPEGQRGHAAVMRRLTRLNRLASKYLYRHEAREQDGARKAYSLVMGSMPDAVASALYERIERECLLPQDGRNYEYMIDLDRLDEDHTTRLEYFEDTVYLEFESMMLPCPARYDEILTDFYGPDWHEIPDESKRVQHSGGGDDDTIVYLDRPYTDFLV